MTDGAVPHDGLEQGISAFRIRSIYLALQSNCAKKIYVCASALAALRPDSALIAAAASSTTCSRIARYSR